MQPDDEAPGTARGLKWEVFPNSDGDVGGWFSYVENATHYLGGDLHPTKVKAEQHAREIVRAALVEMEARDGE